MAVNSPRPYAQASGTVVIANARGFKLAGAQNWLNYSSINPIPVAAKVGDDVVVTYETGKDDRLWIKSLSFVDCMGEYEPEPEDDQGSSREHDARSVSPSASAHGHRGCDGRHDAEDMPLSPLADAEPARDIAVERATHRAALDAAVRLMAPSYATRKEVPNPNTVLGIAEAFLGFLEGSHEPQKEDDIADLPA